MLKYAGVDFEDKLYGFGSGPEPTLDSWAADKFNLGLDFPNVSPKILTSNTKVHGSD